MDVDGVKCKYPYIRQIVCVLKDNKIHGEQSLAFIGCQCVMLPAIP